MSSNVDRMSAILLAKTIVDKRDLLELRGDLSGYVGKLAWYEIFSVGELAEISGLSEYLIRKSSPPDSLIRAKTGVFPRQLDYLLRMVGDPRFSKIHVKTLIEDGATFGALARVTGQSETSLRRWAREE